MFTKMGGYGKVNDFDYYVFSWFWIGIGVLIFSVALFVALKDKRLPACAYLGALIFIALYEPNVQERWDVILLCLICMLAHHLQTHPGSRAVLVLMGFMCTMAPGHLSDAWVEWEIERKNMLFVE